MKLDIDFNESELDLIITSLIGFEHDCVRPRKVNSEIAEIKHLVGKMKNQFIKIRNNKK